MLTEDAEQKNRDTAGSAGVLPEDGGEGRKEGRCDGLGEPDTGATVRTRKTRRISPKKETPEGSGVKPAVYLIRKAKGGIVYVGLSSRPQGRLHDHKRRFGPDIALEIVQDEFLEETPAEAERKWIRYYLAVGCKLINRKSLPPKPKPKPEWADAPRPEFTPEELAFFREQGARGGKKGGRLSWAKLTPEERSERARKAALAPRKKKLVA